MLPKKREILVLGKVSTKSQWILFLCCHWDWWSLKESHFLSLKKIKTCSWLILLLCSPSPLKMKDHEKRFKQLIALFVIAPVNEPQLTSQVFLCAAMIMYMSHYYFRFQFMNIPRPVFLSMRPFLYQTLTTLEQTTSSTLWPNRAR